MSNIDYIRKDLNSLPDINEHIEKDMKYFKGSGQNFFAFLIEVNQKKVSLESKNVKI